MRGPLWIKYLNVSSVSSLRQWLSTKLDAPLIMDAMYRTTGAPKAGAALTHIIRRQPVTNPDEPGIPLWRILSDDGASVSIRHAKRLGRVQLVADEVGGGGEGLAERAEEALAALVDECQAGVGVDHESVVCVHDLVDYDLAVCVCWCGTLWEPLEWGRLDDVLVPVNRGQGSQPGTYSSALVKVCGCHLADKQTQSVETIAATLLVRVDEVGWQSFEVGLGQLPSGTICGSLVL